MEEILFTGRSVTHAQIMKKLLGVNGIRTEIVRPDIKITNGNCSYAVKIPRSYFAESIEILKNNGSAPVRAVLITENQFRELKI